MVHDNHSDGAPEKILAALDADSAFNEDLEIETLPIAVVRDHLAEMGLEASVPGDLRQIVATASAMDGQFVPTQDNNGRLNDYHLTAWYAEMNPKQKSAFWACIGGWALDAMDVQTFSFAIPMLIASFAITNADLGLIGTVTLLTSAFGGWFAGALSDRFGRVRTLRFTILWFAVFTFLCGFAQNYTQLFVLRALMGFGFGGEWAAAAVLVGEVIRSEHRGKAVGAMQSGWAIGWCAAAVLATLLLNTLPQDVAWRALFWVGLTPAVLVFYVRRFVDEPPVFAATQKYLATTSKTANFLEIFSPAMLGTTVLACLLSAGAQGGYYAIAIWLPTFLRNERHITVLETSLYLAIVIAGSFIGYLVSGWLSDRIGRRANLILFAACSIVTLVAYTQIPVNNGIVLRLGFALGFFTSGVFSGMVPFFIELFPTRMRGSGLGFAYNFGRGIAALNPWLIGLVSASLPLGQSIGLFALFAYGLVTFAALLLPERPRAKLTTEADEAQVTVPNARP
jgi:MFS family permease